MPPIEIGPMRRVGAVQPGTASALEKAGTTASARTGSAQVSPPAVTPPVQTTGALDAGSAPVDSDRVAEIRSAVQKGRYPVIPARIGDAMIAAGILLRTA